jgi:hypothetical protein
MQSANIPERLKQILYEKKTAAKRNGRNWQRIKRKHERKMDMKS